jgi:hypothetical protein
MVGCLSAIREFYDSLKKHPDKERWTLTCRVAREPALVVKSLGP